MKNQIFNLIKVTALAAILAAGVSAVSAFTGPSTLPPPGGPASPVSIPVNVSSDAQKKIGGFISELFLKSGVANAFTLTGANAKGWIIAEDTLVSPWSFSIKTFLPGTESQMKIGSPDGTGLAQFTDATFPLTIDLAGRGTAPSPKGRDAIELLANTNYCNTQTTIRTNTPGIQFWSTKNDNNADLIARQVQLNGGNPEKDKVLISMDSDGNATWANVTVTNGVISYTDYTTSPAALGQSICDTVNGWVSGTWGQCEFNDGDPALPASTVGTYQQTRTVVCKNAAGTVVPDNQCPQPKPATNQSCSAPVATGCYAYEIKTNCLGNVGGLGVVIPPGCTKTSTVGQTSCSTQNQGQEIYRIQCTSPITDTVGNGLPNDLPDGPIHFTNSNPIYCPVAPDAIKLWYCHLQGGNWVDQTSQYAFAGSCDTENYQAGYYKSNTYVCSKTKPTGSTCLSPTQSSSGNYTPIVQGCSTAAECLGN